MEATPSKVNLIDKKPDNSIELKLKSDKNLNYDISKKIDYILLE